MSFDPFHTSSTPPKGVNPSTLRFLGAVQFGSRALGVHTDQSDYDFAMLRSTYEAAFKDTNHEQLPLRNYFKIVPPTGNNTLVRKIPAIDGNTIDILVLEHHAHLDVVRGAIYKMTSGNEPFPPYRNKQYRIKVYEKNLLQLGFRTRWPVVIANWILRIF